MKKWWLLFAALPVFVFAEPSELDSYIHSQGDCVQEGHMTPGGKKEKFFTDFLKKHPGIEWIAEIGFNAGHSSECFLKARPSINVVSFDIMNWSYASIGKNYIDQKFPGRHVLIEGDSLEMVPQFAQENPNMKFDFILIDGGHDYSIAKGDIINFRKLSHPNTWLVVDDLDLNSVMRAWRECCQEGVVEEVKFFTGDHWWILGRYVH